MQGDRSSRPVTVSFRSIHKQVPLQKDHCITLVTFDRNTTGGSTSSLPGPVTTKKTNQLTNWEWDSHTGQKPVDQLENGIPIRDDGSKPIELGRYTIPQQSASPIQRSPTPWKAHSRLREGLAGQPGSETKDHGRNYGAGRAVKGPGSVVLPNGIPTGQPVYLWWSAEPGTGLLDHPVVSINIFLIFYLGGAGKFSASDTYTELGVVWGRDIARERSRGAEKTPTNSVNDANLT